MNKEHADYFASLALSIREIYGDDPRLPTGSLAHAVYCYFIYEYWNGVPRLTLKEIGTHLGIHTPSFARYWENIGMIKYDPHVAGKIEFVRLSTVNFGRRMAA